MAEEINNQDKPIKRSAAKNFLVMVLMMISFVYLVNPSAGILELIPDNLPMIGNLDEATAAFVFLGALKYFGLDLLKLFSPIKK